jgi:hypothetical protein
MAEKDPTILLKLGQARADYKNVVATIDEELRQERIKRLSAVRGGIVHLIIEAYVAGHSINAIKLAYGTSDFNTIKNIINENAELIETLRSTPEVEEEEEAWFMVEPGGNVVTIFGESGSTSFNLIDLDADEIMLDAINVPEPDLAWYDGSVLHEQSTHKEGDMYRAIIAERALGY